LQAGPGSAVVQLLVRPGIDRVDERSLADYAGAGTPRPAFVARPVQAGLTQPWLNLTFGRGATAVRLWQRGRTVFTGLVAGAAQAVPVRPRFVPVPPAWTGMAGEVGPADRAEDGLWFAQVCSRPDPELAETYAGAPTGDPVRLLLVRCRPGSTLVAELVGGSATSLATPVTWLGAQPVSTVPAVAVALGTRSPVLLVVGTRDVVAVRAGGRSVAGRVAVLPLRLLARGDAVVVDRSGRQWRL
jgi:hypothetical protein